MNRVLGNLERPAVSHMLNLTTGAYIHYSFIHKTFLGPFFAALLCSLIGTVLTNISSIIPYFCFEILHLAFVRITSDSEQGEFISLFV